MHQSNFDPENFIGPRVPQNPDFQGENFIGPRVPTNPLDFGTLQTGSSKTLQETLTNPNNGTLIWSVSITYGTGWAGWLALNTSGGTILANGNQGLSVTANTSALTPGTYAATLTFSGNFSPNEQVAVNLVVQ
jgi:hypothetical protein